jgi:hypothetical protein
VKFDASCGEASGTPRLAVDGVDARHLRELPHGRERTAGHQRRLHAIAGRAGGVALLVLQQARQGWFEGDGRTDAVRVTHGEIEREDRAKAAAEDQGGFMRHRREHGSCVVRMPLDGHCLLRVVQRAAREAAAVEGHHREAIGEVGQRQVECVGVAVAARQEQQRRPVPRGLEMYGRAVDAEGAVSGADHERPSFGPARCSSPA